MLYDSNGMGITAVLLAGMATVGASAADQAGPRAKKIKPAAADSPMAKVVDDPKLPRVLLIGDSISIGYTVDVRRRLAGKANVHRPRTNCGPTAKGLAEIDQWLGDKPWDVIHFNWGLHDLKYMSADGTPAVDANLPGARHQVPIDQYERNLRTLVMRLKHTGATLIWRSTTPVPPGTKIRVAGDAVKYNRVAARIMRENDIMIDDMYCYALPNLQKIQRPANVHFTPAGSKWLAEHVAAAIETALAGRASVRDHRQGKK